MKRDWKPELTLRDILITISCLLIYPNPASALNAEAGRLVEEDFAEYERKARLWAQIHAAVPAALAGPVEEARKRGEEDTAVVAGPADRTKGKSRRERKVDTEDVFVREDSIQTTPPRQTTMAPPPKGLGIDLPETSLNANTIETPTQQPPRRRKKAAPEPQAASFASTMPTPTPASGTVSKPLIHSTPSTPSIGQPEPKRRRVTPENGADTTADSTLAASTKPELPPAALQEKQDSWLNWQSLSPQSSPEDETRKKRRKLAEGARLLSVGGSFERYNSGVFGPRIGIERL